MADDKAVVVHVENEETKARIEVGFLQANGIDAFLSEDDAGDQIPSFESTHGVKILVPESQAEQARKLLQERNEG